MCKNSVGDSCRRTEGRIPLIHFDFLQVLPTLKGVTARGTDTVAFQR